jgi:hypothetical protein
MNLFTWSIPFVSEKCNEILYHLIKPEANYNSTELPPEYLLHKQML